MLYLLLNLYIAVGIAISYWLEDRGVEVRVPVGSRNRDYSLQDLQSKSLLDSLLDCPLAS
jgi:hypothetical protein